MKLNNLYDNDSAYDIVKKKKKKRNEVLNIYKYYSKVLKYVF